MTIEKHISALLYRYQCVTVPGFGAFLAETVPAQLNADLHTFYPPKKSILFNANVKNNDGLLANHIALQEKISYDEAVALIDHAVSEWHTILYKGQKIELNNLGSIHSNTEGNFVFTPVNDVNYLKEAFGLSTFTSPAVKREEYKAVAEAIEEKAPVIFTTERKRNYNFLKYAAVFAFAIIVGGTGFQMYRYNKAAAETFIVQQEAQEEVQLKIQETTFFIENPFSVTLPVKKETALPKPYHIVAGAYRSHDNALTAVNQLKNKGYSKALVIQKNKFNLYPVLYQSFANHAEAVEALRRIRKSDNTEAWLLIKEL